MNNTRTPVTLTKLSVCSCGFPVLDESIPLGTAYEIDETRLAPLTLVCGGCREVISLIGVFTYGRTAGQDGGYLPASVFTEAASSTQNEVNWIHHDGYQETFARECSVTLEPRPDYCDRGNWIAKVFPTGELARSMDDADAFPRYYFDETRAKLEIEAWLKKRGQL